jgi:tRNA A-37 threonylcarbamoyl transferase component Bud32
LVNAEYLRKVETEYKKRIIAEELMEIQSDYGDFSSNLIIPYEYFLFDKLHKRALEYPDAIESFANTYGGAQKAENLDFTLRGFREAAELLASQGIMEKTEDSVRIFRGRKKRKNALSALYKMHPLTTRGAIQYAFHSFASGLGIESKTKPLLKLRLIDKINPTIELDRPNKLLRLEEGVIFDDASKAIEEIARLSGFSSTYETKETKIGDLINSSKELEIWDDGRRAKFILKHFPQLKSVKWVLLNLWSVAAKRFNMSPLSRLNREVEAVRRLHGLGVKTHRITGIILGERTLVTEYFEGVTLDKSVQEITDGKSADTSDIKKYAQVLGRLHKAGLVYGDTKPQNALVGKNGIYLLDLEQAVERGDRAWDLAEFLYYSAKAAKQAEGMKLVAESFLEAYRAENGNQVIAKARNKRYLIPFLLFLTPEMRREIREALAKYSMPA